MLIQINKKNLYFPINKENELQLVDIYCDNEKIFEFKIPINEVKSDSNHYDYFAAINLESYKGKTINIVVSEEFEDWTKGIFQSNETSELGKESRPKIHFTAGHGWINDPNGLVYYDGEYHLYFQYNPFDTRWENMSWGHAVSTDMLHWEQLDTVLWPDETGTMFSGCAMINERVILDDEVSKEHLVYFYTAAGDTNNWSKDKKFTQRIAISDDKGRSLKKLDYYIPAIETENRDPKVFWHEESSAYIMILWLVDNEFAILRSTDLRSWEISQRFSIDKAWECPDLFELTNVNNDKSKSWVFWCADGYYCLGDFDGYAFEPTTDLLEAYATKLPYAAQTFSGINDRVVSVSWLRTKNKDKTYTGAMAIPKELSLITTKNGERLSQLTVREYYQSRKLIHDNETKTVLDLADSQVKFGDLQNRVIEVEFIFSNNGLDRCYEIFYGDEVCEINLEENLISYASSRNAKNSNDIQEVILKEKINDLQIIFDQEIIEIIGNHGIIYITFEATAQNNRDLSISVSESCNNDIMRVYECI